MGIINALSKVNEKIDHAALKAGRLPDDIKLVAVSKTVGPDKIIEAVKAGVIVLGENRVQEATEKVQDIGLRTKGKKIEWHLIGHLQKNKSKTAIQLFDLIHSLDSPELADTLDKYCGLKGKKQRVLIQVKISDETTKHGVPEKDLMGLIKKVKNLDNLELEGLMTIPPFFSDPEKARPYFSRLRQLKDTATSKGFALPELSMGMSGDYEVAIEEGSTMVRVGTAIFGERTY